MDILDTMSAIYFPKPQPISPNTRTKEIDGVRKQLIKGKWLNVFGVPIANSVYYYWFEYLKRSEKYKTACANNGKGMAKLYKDFGNIFEFEGEEGFWKWWTENDRGVRLFGVKAHGNNWLSLDEAMSLQSDIDENNIKLFAVPTNITKTAVKKRFNKLLAQTEFKTSIQQNKPKYEVANSKVDMPSLRKCLKVYDDNKIHGIDIFRIGCRLAFVEDEIEQLSLDGRSKKRQYKRIVLEEKHADEYWVLHNKVTEQMRKKDKEEKAYWKKVDEEQKKLENPKKRSREDLLSNKGEFDNTKGYSRIGNRQVFNYGEKFAEAMLKQGGRVSDKQRTMSKSAMRTNTYRLLRKAEANIQAVEKGMFAIKH